MDNFDRIREILQCLDRLYNECPVMYAHVSDDLDVIRADIKQIEKDLIESRPQHGGWIFYRQKNGYLWKCSNCSGNFDQQFSYCPNCGAKMYG